MKTKLQTNDGVAVLTLVLAAATSAHASDLIVRVTGIETKSGHVGCALFGSEGGFPMNNAGRPQEWIPVEGTEAVCRFKDVAGGAYAVSVVHDINDNRKLDTNLFGLPTEPWGVSNNARPGLRAPKFDEARVTLDSSRDTTIDIRVAP